MCTSLRAGALAAMWAAAMLAGCAAPDRRPVNREWERAQLIPVAGSRISRRADHTGHAATGTMVQVITDDQLRAMKGTTLGDKLSGR